MKAVVCPEAGRPDVLEVRELPDPVPGPGEVSIRVAAAGLNFADLLSIKGTYQERPQYPFVPGLEVAGRVEAVGTGVLDRKPGDPVMALTSFGGFAELALARHLDVFPVPEGMPLEVAAGFPIAYGTAHAALAWHARLRAGETLLVHGASGGVGLAAVEVGKAMGAWVIATASSEAKCKVAAEAGADHTIAEPGEDLKSQIMTLTDGRGADVVFDPVGGELFRQSLRAIAWGGRLLVIGFAAGDVQQIPANHLLVKQAAAIGVYWGSYRRHAPERLAEEFAELGGWYESGRLTPLVSEFHPMSDAGKALMRLRRRQARGKIVLTIAGQDSP